MSFLTRGLLILGVVLAAPAHAASTENIPVSSQAECRKVNTGGCTAWAIQTVKAKSGRVFVIPSSKVGISTAERCKVSRLRIDWDGKGLMPTPFGDIEVASIAKIVGECQSGGGLNGMGASSKMAWSGKLVEVSAH